MQFRIYLIQVSIDANNRVKNGTYGFVNTISLNSREQEAPSMLKQRQKACKPAAHTRV